MPLNSNELIKIATQLAEQENLRVTLKEAAKGVAIVGSSALAGGLLGGPVGLCVGGIVGSFVSLAATQGAYKGVAQVIMDMTPAQKRQLANSIRKVVQDLRVEDFTILLPMVLNNESVKQRVLQEVVTYVQQEMQMTIVN